MKWPTTVMLIRHDTSEYNVLRDMKKLDCEYQRFLKAFEQDPESALTVRLAKKMAKKWALNISDFNTKLADAEGRQAFQVGQHYASLGRLYVPDIIYVSPYVRAVETLRHITTGWTALKRVEVKRDERIREQEHGLANLYNDWRIFHALHPEQRQLFQQEGPYWYRYPQGENVPDVRDRNRLIQTTLMRDYAEKKVLVVTHHLNILALRANLERLDDKEFIHLDTHDKPINCGVTLYSGYPKRGSDGRLELIYYNKKVYGSE